MNIMWLQIASYVYIILLIIVFFSKNHLSNIENNLYKKLLILNFIGLSIELSCFYTSFNAEALPILNSIVIRLLLVYYIGFIMMYTVYVFMIASNTDTSEDSKINHFYKVVSKICMFIFIIASIIICVLPLDYFNDGTYAYSYGTAVQFLKLFLVTTMVIWSIVIAKNFKNIRTRKYLPIITFILLAGVGGIIQDRYPQILLTTPIETFVVFLMFFTIENPDMRMIRELNKTKDAIEKTNADNSKFLFNITEDIKKTINDVSLIVNNVIDTTSEEETKEEMYKLRYIINNTRARTNQTIDISSLDNKTIKMISNTYDLKKIIKEIELRLKNEIKEGVLFKVELSNTIPNLLYGESVKAKQVLTTLLSNAFKYTKEGYVELRVNTLIKNDTCRLIITVEDTGCGMDIQEINKVLINDTDLNDNDIDRYNELNLNLKIVKKILHMRGNSINIESEKGKGTKVIITIDQKIVNEKNNDIQDIESIRKQVLSRKRIAVVTENSDLSKKIIKTLSKINVDKIECKHAKDCLDKIRKNEKIDLIICQEYMDKIDARGLLEKIKKEEHNVPIIMISDNEDYDLKRVKLEGFRSCLNENEISTELIKKINMLFED